MKTLASKLTRFSVLLLLWSAHSGACDCSLCPTPGDESATRQSASDYYFHVAEQFTHFGTLRADGARVDNPADQYLNSSITHLVGGATFLDGKLAVQISVPLISRHYKRPEGDEIVRGTESGLGDLSLLLNARLFHHESCETECGASGKGARQTAPACGPDFTTSLNLLAGLKFPTGDSSRLKEEAEEGDEHADGHQHGHEATASGIHGHDLALGSGSWDGIFGLASFTRYKNFFLQMELQYAVRGPGRHSYRYANDLTWEGGPGIYLQRDGAGSIGLQALFLGETKGKDKFNGEQAGDTGLTALFIGPRLLVERGNWSADAGCGWPVVMHNTALQSTADFRIRAGVTCRF